jgi:hypothetical protein
VTNTEHGFRGKLKAIAQEFLGFFRELERRPNDGQDQIES